MLLRFRTENHRSVRDEVELSLMRARSAPGGMVAGIDASLVLPVAAIYGPNASGKSTVIEALGFLVHAVSQSATQWTGAPAVPHRPFRLDAASAERESSYEVDVVVDGYHYTYGFSCTAAAVTGEWLLAHEPDGTERVVLDRDGGDLVLGEEASPVMRALADSVHHQALIASMAMLVRPADGGEIAAVARFLRDSVRVLVPAWDPFALSRQVRQALADDRLADDVRRWLRHADLGIADVRVETSEVANDDIAALKGLQQQLATSAVVGGVPDIAQLIDDAAHRLVFTHVSTEGVSGSEVIGESSGTIAWLSSLIQALSVLRHGGVLVLDEFGTSLHPRLAAAFVQMFVRAWPSSNAQLIVTTHDVSLLGDHGVEPLDPDSVWFTEKRGDGVTRLFSLAEFATRGGDDLRREYLQGRYGAVPVGVDVMPSESWARGARSAAPGVRDAAGDRNGR